MTVSALRVQDIVLFAIWIFTVSCLEILFSVKRFTRKLCVWIPYFVSVYSYLFGTYIGLRVMRRVAASW